MEQSIVCARVSVRANDNFRHQMASDQDISRRRIRSGTAWCMSDTSRRDIACRSRRAGHIRQRTDAEALRRLAAVGYRRNVDRFQLNA